MARLVEEPLLSTAPLDGSQDGQDSESDSESASEAQAECTPVLPCVSDVAMIAAVAVPHCPEEHAKPARTSASAEHAIPSADVVEPDGGADGSSSSDWTSSDEDEPAVQRKGGHGGRASDSDEDEGATGAAQAPRTKNEILTAEVEPESFE